MRINSIAKWRVQFGHAGLELAGRRIGWFSLPALGVKWKSPAQASRRRWRRYITCQIDGRSAILPIMKLNPQELEKIADVTLDHYNQRADDFWEGTRDHDVSQNIETLLAHIQVPPLRPIAILDFGCGPGRDLKAFADLGHRAVGLEGSARFAEMARAHSRCEVLQQDFLKLNLPAAEFDGVFANASLFHVPRQELPRVLAELRATLIPNGVLFASNPRGDNSEGWNNGRFGAYHDLAAWRGFMSGAGFAEIAHYYRPPGAPRDQQPWLASVWRK